MRPLIFCLFIFLVTASTFGSCKKKHYRLKFENDIPEVVSKRFADKVFNEGPNILDDGNGGTIFVDIKNGELKEIWYRDNEDETIPPDSVNIMAKDNNAPNGGGNNQADCENKENACLDACPWKVLKRDPLGRPIEWGYEKECLKKCEDEYYRCLFGDKKKGLAGSIGVIRD